MKQLSFYCFFSTLILFSGCTKEPVDNSPSIIITAEPNPVNFLESTHLSWSCSNVIECTINGQPAQLNYNKIISNIISDTTFIITGSGPNGIISKTLTVKVGEKTLYAKYLDTLCSGKWVVTQTRTYGIPLWGTKPNEWYIANTHLYDGVGYDDYPFSSVFVKDNKYSNLKLMLLDENYLINEPVQFILSKDLKTIRFDYPPSWGGSEKPRDILSISNDSLVLLRPSAGIVWAGSNGSGSGFFPMISRYEHFAGYNDIISTNDASSNVYKILTSKYWKIAYEKMYINGVYHYTTNLTDDMKNTLFYFQPDGVLAWSLGGKIQGGNRWYLTDNNTKIRLTGSIPSNISEIAYLDDYKLILKRTIPFIDNKEHFSTQEICYYRN